jgi:hypothetical protein
MALAHVHRDWVNINCIIMCYLNVSKTSNDQWSLKSRARINSKKKRILADKKMQFCGFPKKLHINHKLCYNTNSYYFERTIKLCNSRINVSPNTLYRLQK